MNLANCSKYAAIYYRHEIPSDCKIPLEDGWSQWVENGKRIRAITVTTGLKHAWENGGYEKGIRDCPCGCFMLSYSSGGPVDPFGDCPYTQKGGDAT